LEKLLQAVTFNALIGNGDAHAKNFSLLHHASGALTLAPLYDLLCTLHYGDDRLAMYIDNVHRTSRVTTERIVNEAARWGLARDHSLTIIENLLTKAPDAITVALEATPGVPADLVATIERQLVRLQSAG
jgi:serine/threonine-protein kinase HipA